MTNGTGTAGIIRRVSTAMALAVAVATLVGACGGRDTEPASAPPSTPAATPKEALLASVPDGTEGSFRFTGRDASSDISGLIDPAVKGMQLSTSSKDQELGFTMKMAFLVIDEQIWMKVNFTGAEGLTGLPKLPKRWLKLDRAKLTDGETAPTYEGTDPGNAGPLIEAATSVEEQRPGRYAGVIDLVSGEAAQLLEADEMKALGAAAGAVPFTAVVGPDGNLTSLTLQIPEAGNRKAYPYVVEYLDYGTAPKISEPAGGEAQDAPAVAYELLNG